MFRVHRALVWILPIALVVIAAGVHARSDRPLSREPAESPAARAATTSARLPHGLSASDWSSIREAHERQRHAVMAVSGDPGTWRTRTPSQQWTAQFDGEGVLVTPDAGGWTWGLQLARYGIAGAETRMTTPARVQVDQERVTYAWSADLDEWFVNETRGLEHGFTLHHRPGDGIGPVALQLAVRGGLTPRVQADGRGVAFLRDGAAVMTYAGLSVVDADGQTLPARFEPEDGAVRLVVDDRGARYPVTIDPIAQQAYLKASNTDTVDEFGWSVAVSGDTVVVAALGEDSSATGVNGDQGNNLAGNSGAAYVFVRSGGIWSQQAYLKASNAAANDWFGWSVAVSGDTVVVGALQESSNATGINGDQTNDGAFAAGAAYVFVRSGGVWSQQAYLKAFNTETFDQFGYYVGASGDTIVIGTPFEDSNATGVNGDGTNNNAPDSGAAYVFVRSGGAWTQQAYLKASNTAANDIFGWSVAVSADTVVVGAMDEDSNATGVNGNQANNSATSSGAAYVFARTAGVWAQEAYLKASNTGAGDQFGNSVAVSGDTAVVGAWRETSNATGINGDQTNNSLTMAGAAYVFARSGGVWGQQAYVKASNTNFNDKFGYSVAVSGDTVVVGAHGEQSNATGVNGDQTNNSMDAAGAAYVFVSSAGVWSQQAYLKASNTSGVDQFGYSVAISDGTVLVGALGEGSNATGVNGDQSNNSKTHAGASYVFVIPTTSPTVASVTPASGSGASQTFNYVFSDPDGFADISWTAMFISGSSGGHCVVFFARASSALLLLNDAGSAWLGPVTAGGVGKLQNSQCILDSAASSSLGASTNLTVNLALTFKGTFAGVKANLAVVTDNAAHTSNWQVAGTFTATNPPPTVTSVTPSSGSGSSQTFSYVFADPNGFADIAWTAAMVSSGTVAGGCLVFFDRASTALLLLNDAGSAWLGPALAGSGGTLQNSQCVVNATGSSLSGAGPNLTLNLALTFTPAYTGGKFNFTVATDNASQSSNWQVPGIWIVP